MKTKTNGIETSYELHGKEGAPWLVLCGDQDPGTPPAMAREIHDNAPGSKLVMIAQAAHLSNLENPAAFTKAMQEFLAAR